MKRWLFISIAVIPLLLLSGCIYEPLEGDLDMGGYSILDMDSLEWSGGNVTYVPIDGDIQAYVNDATAGDTLVLASGEYVITSTITINKQLNIIGWGNAGFTTFPITPSHGTLISCATNNVTVFDITNNNVRIANMSVNMTGDNSMAINVATNLVGIVFNGIDVIVDCAGTAQAFTLNSSDAVLRDLTFYVTSSDNTASGVLVYNNGTSTKDAIVDCFNVTGTVQGGATSAYAFGAWNNNDGGHSITLNLSNSVARVLAGTPLDVAVVSYSVTTNNAIVNAYFCTLDGAIWDALQTGTNELNLGGSVLVNGLVSGTVTYRATMASGELEISGDADVGGTLSCPSYTGQNLTLTGKIEGDRLFADVEGYSIDVVQSSDLNIILNDTLDLVFLFVPDVIVLDYTGRCQHDTTLDDGHTTGHSVITVTGVDTITYNTNYTALVNNGGAFGSHIGQNDAVNAVVVYGGNDGVDDGYFYGVGSWTTATKTLRLTFSTVANTNTATNYIEILATAYR